MKKTAIIDLIKKYAITTLGCLLFALGVSLFLSANSIASGGATGISILISYLSGNTWDTGIILLVINIPLLIMGTIVFGKKFAVSTVYSTVMSSLMMTAITTLGNHFGFLPVTDNLLISAVFGAILFGIGVGIIFRMGGSTGGTDVIVKWLRTKFRYLKTGRISLIFDLIIVTISVISMHDWSTPVTGMVETIFYAVVSIVVFTSTFDTVLYGGSSATLVYIIAQPEKAEVIKKRILSELDLGATFLDAKGAYSNDDKKILLCAVKNIYYPKLRDVVKEEDDSAFMIVTSSKEIYGEGYKNHNDEEL